MKTKQIWFIMLLGLILRLIVIFWSFNFPQNPDLLRHRDWGRIAFLYGIDQTYNSQHLSYGNKPNNLPPGSSYIIAGSYSSSILAGKILLKLFHLQEGSSNFLNIYLVDFFLKLPSVIVDLVIAYLIYLIVKIKKDHKIALLAASIFLFNPVVFYNSAFWGQIDALNNLAFLLSLFFFIRNKIFLSVFFFLFSLYFKLSLLPFLPFYLFLYYLYRIKLIKLLKSVFISLFILFGLTILSFPDIASWPNIFLLHNFQQEENLISVNAFNFWYLIFLPFSQNNIIPPSNLLMSLVGYGTFLLISLSLAILLLKKRKKISERPLFLTLSLLALVLFLFLPRVHERYLYPLFPLLAIAVAFDSKLILPYLLLSVFHLLNLLFVWHPLISGELSQIITNIWIGWVISLGIIVTGMGLMRKNFIS